MIPVPGVMWQGPEVEKISASNEREASTADVGWAQGPSMGWGLGAPASSVRTAAVS